MANPSYFLSTTYFCDTNQQDFARLRVGRYGSQGPAGDCVRVPTGETLWSMPEFKKERLYTLDEMLAKVRASVPSPELATQFTATTARPVVAIPAPSFKRGRRSRPVTIWARDLPAPTTYACHHHKAPGPNTLTLTGMHAG